MTYRYVAFFGVELFTFGLHAARRSRAWRARPTRSRPTPDTLALGPLHIPLLSRIHSMTARPLLLRLPSSPPISLLISPSPASIHPAHKPRFRTQNFPTATNPLNPQPPTTPPPPPQTITSPAQPPAPRCTHPPGTTRSPTPRSRCFLLHRRTHWLLLVVPPPSRAGSPPPKKKPKKPPACPRCPSAVAFRQTLTASPTRHPRISTTPGTPLSDGFAQPRGDPRPV